MKKIFTISALLIAALCMSAQGNQKIIYDDDFGYEFYFRGTHPDFSSEGKVHLFGRNLNYTNEGVESETFTIFDDNFDQQREWTVPITKADCYNQEFVAEVTGYNVEKEGEDYVHKEYDANYSSFSYFDYDGNEGWIEVSGPLTVENARRYITLRTGYTILNEVSNSEGTYFYIKLLLSDKN